MVGLSADKKRILKEYSKGMRQRIGLAQALINDPDLLFLDEPTSGLDPIAHLDIRDMILRLRDEGRTVFLSSHQLSDVEMVCDRVSILDRGKLMRVGSLKEMLAGKSVEIRAERVRDDIFEKIKAHSSDAFTVDGAIRVRVEQSFVNETVQMIMQTGGEITAVIPGKRTLEDIFIETVREGTVS